MMREVDEPDLGGLLVGWLVALVRAGYAAWRWVA